MNNISSELTDADRLKRIETGLIQLKAAEARRQELLDRAYRLLGINEQLEEVA